MLFKDDLCEVLANNVEKFLIKKKKKFFRIRVNQRYGEEPDDYTLVGLLVGNFNYEDNKLIIWLEYYQEDDGDEDDDNDLLKNKISFQDKGNGIYIFKIWTKEGTGFLIVNFNTQICEVLDKGNMNDIFVVLTFEFTETDCI
jgi:hypothetical protein